MTIKVDYNSATNELILSMARVQANPVESCIISNAIDTVFEGSGCITYQYILLTALVAKATEPAIDILTLQVEDPSPGAYAPRPLCKEVVYPFQKTCLEDVIDGVNKPARWERLTKANKARGDGRKALDALCDHLPKVADRETARHCLDYVMTRLVRMAEARRKARADVVESVTASSAAELRTFLSDLLDQGFGGNALVLATSALYRIQFPVEQGYEVIPHPVNQPGSSKRQLSDLDLKLNGDFFIGTELKDKPFDESDVRHAARTAAEGGLKSIVFVSGRSGNLSAQTRAYFNEVRGEFASKGVYVGLVDIDALMDIVLASHHDIDVPAALTAVYDQVMNNAGTPETQRWVYYRLVELK